MSEQFNVILTGEFLPGTSSQDGSAAFARLFKIDLAQAENTLARAPLQIKAGVDEKTAQAFAKALTQAGIGHRIELGSQAGAAPAPASASAPMPAPAAPAAAPVYAPEPAPVPAPTSPVSLKKSDGPGAPAKWVPGNPSVFEPAHAQGYRFRIEGKPDYAFVTVQLPAGQMIKVEASAMATMDTHIQMKTRLKGGFSRLLAGESIFLNEFTAQGAPGEIGIAPAAPGDLMHQYLDGEILYLQNSAFVACSPDVSIETKWQGLTKGFFSGEGMFLIRATGRGDLWFNTYGASIEIDVTDDYVVDTGNIVAFTEGLEYKITKVGGYKSLFFSGEGFVCRFSGKGKVWLQTRTPSAFVTWAKRFRPVKSSG